MARKIGTVRQLPSERFQARWRPEHAPAAVSTFDTKEEAEAWILEQVALRRAAEREAVSHD